MAWSALDGNAGLDGRGSRRHAHGSRRHAQALVHGSVCTALYTALGCACFLFLHYRGCLFHAF